MDPWHFILMTGLFLLGFGVYRNTLILQQTQEDLRLVTALATTWATLWNSDTATLQDALMKTLIRHGRG